MKITITLNENEIIEVLRKHYTELGFEVYDWQLYKNQGDVNADLRLKADAIGVLKSQSTRYSEEIEDKF